MPQETFEGESLPVYSPSPPPSISFYFVRKTRPETQLRGGIDLNVLILDSVSRPTGETV